MEKAIKKAIEGGYEYHGDIDDYEEKLTYLSHEEKETNYKQLLDPLFWQAIGEAEGWPVFVSLANRWLSVWHDFIDHIAEEKDIDSFFTNLLK